MVKYQIENKAAHPSLSIHDLEVNVFLNHLFLMLSNNSWSLNLEPNLTTHSSWNRVTWKTDIDEWKKIVIEMILLSLLIPWYFGRLMKILRHTCFSRHPVIFILKVLLNTYLKQRKTYWANLWSFVVLFFLLFQRIPSIMN